MKSKEELNALKEEVKTVSGRLHELTQEELAQVCDGSYIDKTKGTVTIAVTYPGGGISEGDHVKSH